MTSPLAQIIDSEGLLLIEGDCVQIMSNLPAECVDSVVTDPPYGLEFMGKEWDKLAPDIPQWVRLRMSGGDAGMDSWQGEAYSRRGNYMYHRLEKHKTSLLELQMRWHYSWAVEALRLLKPGGHMLVFGGTRTYHRLACAVEDAGFEIRDSIHWIYGSGFPKSMDVSKAIDKAAGVERAKISGGSGPGWQRNIGNTRPWMDEEDHQIDGPEPATDDAKQWDGWGTALKPAHEPILLARKPLGEKTVAGNVLKWGTGGLNIDGGRIGTPESLRGSTVRDDIRGGNYGSGHVRAHNVPMYYQKKGGRFPANFILSHDEDCEEECVEGCPVTELDAQSGLTWSGGNTGRAKTAGGGSIFGSAEGLPADGRKISHGWGGPSRFFYQAKSPKSERNSGCDDLYWRRTKSGHEPITQDEYEALDPKSRAQGNIHPTVKPLSLMRYLIRLITPCNGIVLEPFLGSGTTALAAHQEGFGCLAMEQDPNSALISRTRWSNR